MNGSAPGPPLIENPTRLETSVPTMATPPLHATDPSPKRRAINLRVPPSAILTSELWKLVENRRSRGAQEEDHA